MKSYRVADHDGRSGDVVVFDVALSHLHDVGGIVDDNRGGTTGGINIVALFCEWAATTLGQDKLSFSFFRILQW